MVGVPRRVRGCMVSLGLLLFAPVGEAVAQAQVPGAYAPGSAAQTPVAPPVTYTPMRRPGSASPPASAGRPPVPPTPNYVPARPVPVAPPTPVAPVVPYAPAPVAAPAPAASYPPYAPWPSMVPYGGQPGYVPSTPYARPVAPAPAATVAAAPRAAKVPTGPRTLGLGLDVGVPDGANLGLVIAPADWARLQFAFGTNSAGLGYRGGVTFVPVGWGPSFNFEAGHCNMAPTNGLIRSMFNAPKWVAPYVQELGYTYLNAHLGFDLVFGGVTVFVHGGYTYLMGSVRGTTPVVIDSSTNTKVTLRQDGEVTVHTLSAKLGVIYMFGGS